MLTRPTAQTTWLAGTLELASKVRYGLTSRGVPIFRFIPYDRRYGPFAVGSSARDLFYNVHAIVEPLTEPLPKDKGQLPRANLIQTFGKPAPESEKILLRQTFAFDSKKELRKEAQAADSLLHISLDDRINVQEGFTFHIDPQGCKDVDDAFTIALHPLLPDTWTIWIHIADVAAWVPAGSLTDQEARERATTFYTPQGQAEAPMLARNLSEGRASLTPGPAKPALSLKFLWSPANGASDFTWYSTSIQTQQTYTYEEAATAEENTIELQILRKATGGSEDSHVWVQEMMILYNTKAAELLAAAGTGILRRHAGPSAEKVQALEPFLAAHPELSFLATDAAEYCLSSDTDTRHIGLDRDVYAYASSPLRRYADLVNQRALHAILDGIAARPLTQDLIDHLNRREKQAKAFSRDLFFSTELASKESQVRGIVVSTDVDQLTNRVYVPAFKRIVKVRALSAELLHTPLTHVSLTWFDDRTKPNWKERIVFAAH